MIAAGSLFTSCVENTEPQGIRDLREAKADYLASLSKLREADAELVKAQAAYQSAQIAVVEADAALKQAEANIAQALADAAQIGVEYLDAKLQIELEDARAQAEIAAVKAQEDLAKAQFSYEQTLRNLVAKSVGLNPEEVKVLDAKVKNLEKAQADYHEAFVAVERQKMDIWEAEYDSIHQFTVDDWKAKIAKAESSIASAQANIADLKEMKEEPESIQAYLKVYQDSIQDLRKDSLLALQQKELYEITVLKEANKAYKEAWDKFKKDSVDIYPKVDFAFAEEEDDELIPIEYALTDGKGVDATFRKWVNGYWKVNNHSVQEGTDWTESTADEEKKYDPWKLGFYVSDKATIEVGLNKYNNIPVTPSKLTEGVAVIEEIVETLNRDMVVVANINDSTTIEEAKIAAFKADSTFDDHYDILKAGLKEWQVYKDSAAKIEPLQKKLDSLKGVLKAAETKLAGDSTTVLANAKTLASAYKTAIDNFVDRAILFPSKKDTANFISAVNALGAAQAAYLNRQDTVVVEKLVATLSSGKKVYDNVKVPFSALTKADFKAIKDAGEKGHYAQVLAAANCEATTGGITDKKIAAKVGDKPVNYTYDGKDFAYTPDPKANKEDTINWIKNFDFAKKAFDADAKAVTDAKADTVKAHDAVANYQGLDIAKKAYAEIYRSFWGYTEYTLTDDDYKAYPFTWTKKTFLEPTNCVEFTYYRYKKNLYEPVVINNSALQLIIEEVDPNGIFYIRETTVSGEVYYSEYYKIFTNPSNLKRTEIAEAILRAQIVEDLGDYTSNKARLEKINAQVAQIKADVEAAIAANKAANAAHNAAWKRFTGKDETKAVKVLADANVNNGKWNLAGKQLELANQFAPEYPAIVKNAVSGVAAIEEKIADTQKFIAFLTDTYIKYKNIDDEAAYTSIDDIIDAIEEEIDDLDAKITSNIEKIDAYNHAIAQIEAGYDPYTVYVKVLKDELAKLEAELERAEAQLKIAQKEYDEVIALYGVNE